MKNSNTISNEKQNQPQDCDVSDCKVEEEDNSFDIIKVYDNIMKTEGEAKDNKEIENYNTEENTYKFAEDSRRNSTTENSNFVFNSSNLNKIKEKAIMDFGNNNFFSSERSINQQNYRFPSSNLPGNCPTNPKSFKSCSQLNNSNQDYGNCMENQNLPSDFYCPQNQLGQSNFTGNNSNFIYNQYNQIYSPFQGQQFNNYYNGGMNFPLNQVNMVGQAYQPNFPIQQLPLGGYYGQVNNNLNQQPFLNANYLNDINNYNYCMNSQIFKSENVLNKMPGALNSNIFPVSQYSSNNLIEGNIENPKKLENSSKNLKTNVSSKNKPKKDNSNSQIDLSSSKFNKSKNYEVNKSKKSNDELIEEGKSSSSNSQKKNKKHKIAKNKEHDRSNEVNSSLSTSKVNKSRRQNNELKKEKQRAMPDHAEYKVFNSNSDVFNSYNNVKSKMQKENEGSVRKNESKNQAIRNRENEKNGVKIKSNRDLLFNSSNNVSKMENTIFNDDETLNSKYEKIKDFLDNFENEEKIVNYLCTPKGSGHFQSFLRKANESIIELLVIKFSKSLKTIITNSYANYFFQKICQQLKEKQRLIILSNIKEDFFYIASDSCGTHALQALLDNVYTEEEANLLYDIIEYNIIEHCKVSKYISLFL